MAPTESTILSNYLLVPSQLESIISLEEFKELFPRSQQNSTQIRALYRDLQQQRSALLEEVNESIEDEAKHGKALRRTVIRARQAAEAEEYEDEVEIERTLFGSDPRDPKHNLNSILHEMESAVSDLEKEIELLQAEETSLLQSVQQTVGKMSDLRYGRLENSQLRDQVTEGLANLQETCKRKS